MNRIAGIFYLDHTLVAPQEIARMLASRKYTPHDEQQLWVAGSVGLGCLRFGPSNKEAVSGDHDALDSPRFNLRCTVAFDGRIDNRQALLAHLRPQFVPTGARFSDAEIVLAAYEKWELECPQHLIGDFAFAIWDGKKRQLLCARDPFGVKPLYYSFSHQAFVFASTPQAVLASRKVPPAIHEERIADFLVNPLEGVDKTSSFYVDVFRLPPAHMLVIEEGRMRLERYWELCPERYSGWRTEEETIDAFQELLAEAVRCRLQDSQMPASMLSGGMDSSAIIGMGRRVTAEEGKCLHALAVISNSIATNRETACITSVLGQGGLEPHLISEADVTQRVDELVRAIEAEAEPFDCLMNLNRAVYLHACDHGIRSVLDGVDGDILLSASGSILLLWRQAAFRSLLQETVWASGLTAEYKTGKKDLGESFLSAIALFEPCWMRRIRHQRGYRAAAGNAIRYSIISSDFALKSRLGERLAKVDAHRHRPRSLTQLEFHKIDLQHPFLTVGLERYERVASSFGIEARHPFTDVRLAEFCLALPWQLKTRRGWTKMILRKAMEPYLPANVVWRKDKDSLMWEVNRLVLKERAEYFYQITQDEQASLKPYVDTAKLTKFWQEYLTQGDETHAELIWSGIALAMWLRRQKKISAAFTQ